LDILTRLAITLSKPNQPTDVLLRYICLSTVQAISGCNRASLWVFNEAKDEIRCLYCYEKLTNTYSSDFILTKKDFPAYFDGIISNQVVMASDARQHPTTSCFNKSYFEPNNIYSLLDYIFHEDFTPKGIICCESVGATTQWQVDDIVVLKRIATMASTFFRISY
jgi:hypothetical protein